MQGSYATLATNRGRRLASAVFACVLLAAAGLLASAVAQRVIVEPPRVNVPPALPAPGTSGLGGGAGLTPALPQIPGAPALTPPLAPAMPAPADPVLLPPPVSAEPAPAEPAKIVRFRCEVAPEAQSCREAGAPDGGGDDSECDCTRDSCYDQLDPATGHSHRMCQKL